MHPERFDRIERLFGEALDRSAADQRAILGAVAREDPDLAAEVKRLLTADAEAGSFLEDVVAAGASTMAEGEIGRRLGPYRLIRVLGRGGMGAVYLAERDVAGGELPPRVAVKLLHRGLETEEILSRFQTERQILARLEHPAIASLFDGGTSDDGRPYFVMELIDGRPIDVHCDAEGLPVRARLQLLLEVFAAVREAHRNLVVHRDLKPSNVLVTADGRPKLLDFGVAELLEPETPGGPEPVRRESAPMTLAWASPEQVLGLPVTPATDVYSLGVLLYRLLTGVHPYPVADRSAREIERLILDHRPERPSAAVLRTPASEADRRGISPAGLARQLRGGLDSIVLAALAKEPAGRYGSVERLAADVRLHLEGRRIRGRTGCPTARERRRPPPCRSRCCPSCGRSAR